MAHSDSPNCDLSEKANPAQYSCSIASNIEEMRRSLICFSGIQRAIQIFVKFSSFHFLHLARVADTFDCANQVLSAIS